MAATASNGSILWTVDSVSPSDLVVSFSDATAEDPTVTLSKVGTATLKMTVTSQSNPSCGTASDTVDVTVYPEPTAAAGPDQAKCAGEPNGKVFAMAATASNGSILWTVDSQSPSDLVVSFSDATAEDPTVTLSKVGTATLKMTVTSQSNPSCGTASDTVDVTVYPEPTAAAGPDQAKCAGEPNGKVFAMAATASNGSILWTVDSQSPSDLVVSFSDATAEDPTVTLSKVGTATLKMTVTSQSNPSCGTASDTVDVTVYPEPTAAAGPDQAKCAGEPNGKVFAMAATASNGSILWTVDSQSPSDLVVSFSDATAEDPTVTLSKVGTATLKMTVTSQSNPSCGTASDTVDVTVYPEPTAAAGPDQAKCAGEPNGKVFAMAATASNGSILWTVDSQSPSDLVVSFSDATAEDPTVTLSKVGTATLKMTVTSQSNPSCGTASDTVDVTVYPEPTAAAGPDQKKCEDDGKSFAMAATASNGSILWTVDSVSPSDLVVSFSDATAEDPTVTLSKVGTATLKMTVTSQSNPSCGNASDTVDVTVYPEPAAAAGPDQKKCEDV